MMKWLSELIQTPAEACEEPLTTEEYRFCLVGSIVLLVAVIVCAFL